MGSCCNRLGYLSCNLAPLVMKGGVEAPPKDMNNKSKSKNYKHHINCHEQYKNIGRSAIILRGA
jgi:hypothetical protein